MITQSLATMLQSKQLKPPQCLNNNSVFTVLSVDEVCNCFSNDPFFMIHKTEARILKNIQDELISTNEKYKCSPPTTKKELKLWIGVLWGLYAVSDSRAQEHYGRLAWEKSLEINSSKFRYGSACRVGLLDDVVHMKELIETMENRSGTDLMYCAKALFLIFNRSGKMEEEARRYCLYASLFNAEYESYYEQIVSQSVAEIKKEIHEAISFGLPHSKLIDVALVKVRNENYVGCNNHDLMRHLQELEQFIPIEVSPHKLQIDIEKFILRGVWNEDTYISIMKNGPSLSMLHRLRETFNGLKVEKQDHSSYETQYPLLSLNLVRKFFQFPMDFLTSLNVDRSELENNIELCPVSALLVADYFMEKSQEFIAVCVLLQFAELSEKWFRNFDIFSVEDHVSAHWYFVMVCCYERCLSVYPKHPLAADWKQHVERLTKIKECLKIDCEYESD